MPHEEDWFHQRLTVVERMAKRHKNAPTVPKYDLSVAANIYPLTRHAWNNTDAGFSTGNGVGNNIGVSPPWYIELEWFLPQLTFDTINNHAGYTAAWIVLANSNINTTGGPAEGIYISSDITGSSTFTSSPDPANWAYNTENTLHSSIISPTFDPTTIHTERIYYDGSNVTFRIDGVDLWTFALGFVPDRYYIGAIYGTGIGGNVAYYIASLKVGTTPGGNDVFEADFSQAVPTWDYSIGGGATLSFTQTDADGHYTIP